jgi:hypothetical protein
MTQHEKTIKFNQEKKEKNKRQKNNRESEETVGKTFAEGRKKLHLCGWKKFPCH